MNVLWRGDSDRHKVRRQENTFWQPRIKSSLTQGFFFFSVCADAGKAELVSSLLTPLPPLQGNTLRKNRIYIARRETVESNGLLSPESKQETSGFPCT